MYILPSVAAHKQDQKGRKEAAADRKKKQQAATAMATTLQATDNTPPSVPPSVPPQLSSTHSSPPNGQTDVTVAAPPSQAEDGGHESMETDVPNSKQL